MSKAKELLEELQHLDIDIQCRIDEIEQLEASMLSSPKYHANKIQVGTHRKIDDIYTSILTMKERIKNDAQKIIERKLEICSLIDKLKNPKHRAVLRMTYINKGTADSVCYDLKMSRTTYYKLRKQAIAELDKLL